MKNLCLTAILVFSVAVELVAAAQVPTGSIVGTVSDPTGAVAPNVKLTLSSESGITRTTTTAPTGYYEFVQLPAGTYDVTAELSGFQRAVRRRLALSAGQVVRLDVALQVGDVAVSVDVTSEAPLIEPDKTSLGNVIDSRTLTTLPTQARNFLDLAQLTPGSIPNTPGGQVGGISVAGMRNQSNNYTLDGISNNDPQNNGILSLLNLFEAVQEFNVQTSIASAEVGRQSGAQVSVITKSGGNAYHGSLFYTGRNEALDATPFFFNRAGRNADGIPVVPKNVLRRHQFGGSVGGYLRRDQTFWFLSFEGFRQKNPSPQTARVPTPEERAAVTDPVSRRLLQFWPQPNTPLVGGRNWAGASDSLFNSETYFLRVDHNLSDHHRLMGRGALVRGRSLSQSASPFNGNITNRPEQYSYIVQLTSSGARWVNEARIGFSRNVTAFRTADISLNPAEIFTDAAGKPLPGYVDTRVDSLNGGLPLITITGFTNGGLGAGNNMPQGRATNTYEVIDNLALTGPWDWSRHTLRFGAHLRREISNRFDNTAFRGNITFPSWARFATGQPQTGTLATGGPGVFGTHRTWFRTAWSFYTQDTFKPRPNLTLNYGLRYEIPGESYEKYDGGSNFVPGVGMVLLNSNQRIDVDPTALGRAALRLTPVAGTDLPRSGQFNADYNNLAPYLGIAWSPKVWPGFFGDGKTVIRTGFRISYDDIFHNVPINLGVNHPPFLTTTLPTGTYTWATALNQNRRLFAADATVPGGERGLVDFRAYDTDPPTAYAMHYALEIERQLGKDFAAEISYIGSQGRKLGGHVNVNTPEVIVNNPAMRGDQAPNVRRFPFPQYSTLRLGKFTSNSNYNGMVLALRKRFSHGSSFEASYTLAKSLDDNSGFLGGTPETLFPANPHNRKLNRGRSAFDLRQRAVVWYIADIPVGPGRALLGGASGWLGQVVGGWQISGITAYRTGFPFNVLAGPTLDWSGFAQFADRPNWAPRVRSLPTDMRNPDQAFGCRAPLATNCPVFALPGAGDAGNVGRNAFTGPSAINWDFSVLKNFPFGEKRRVGFRMDFFNLFNHTNFGLPVANLQSPSVGTIGGAADPRLIQFGLRIDW